MAASLEISQAIQRASEESGVDYQLMAGFAQIESGFNAGAVSPTGVGGLFQITRATWAGYAHGEPYSIDPYRQSVVASRIIADLQAKYKDPSLMAIAYNAGPGVANKLVGKELTYANIQAAVLATKWSSKVDPHQKVNEVYNYAPRLSKAMGGSGIPGGPGGFPSSQQNIQDTGPTDADAQNNHTIPLSFDVAGAVPITPIKMIQDGLELASWYQKDPTQPGGFVGNPHLRGQSPPAWFEMRLNRTNGESLCGRDGTPIQVRLNVSLQSLNTKMQHIVSREPTATGLMITLWGSQPDMIVGRGTTGAFINQFGLAALMSNKLTVKASGWYQLLQEAYRDPATRNALLGSGGQARDCFRIAAQDAFAELLALFKNNGVTRFLPKSWAEDIINNANRAGGSTAIESASYKQAADMLEQYQDNGDVWSPAAGATGFQMLHRAGDVYTRGHVVFRYKGQTNLGYFKSLNFSANANSPFKWDFDFTFRVLKSITPLFKSSE